MKDSAILPFCRKNGIRFPLNWRSHCGCVKPHDRNETDKHWQYKCDIFRALFKQGQTVFSEMAFDYGKNTSFHANRLRFPTCDLFWLDERMVIELESKPTDEIRSLKKLQFRDFNCFVFDLRKFTVRGILSKIGAKQ